MKEKRAMNKVNTQNNQTNTNEIDVNEEENETDDKEQNGKSMGFFLNTKLQIEKICSVLKGHPWTTIMIAGLAYGVVHWWIYSWNKAYVSYFGIDISNISFYVRDIINNYVAAVVVCGVITFTIILIYNFYSRWCYLLVLSLCIVIALASFGTMYWIKEFWLTEQLAVIGALASLIYLICCVFVIIKKISDKVNDKIKAKSKKNNKCKESKVNRNLEVVFGVVLIIIMSFIFVNTPVYHGETKALYKKDFLLINDTKYAVVYETKENYFCVPYSEKTEDTLNINIGTYTVLDKKDKVVKKHEFKEVIKKVEP